MGQPAWNETLVVPPHLRVAELGEACKVWTSPGAMTHATSPIVVGIATLVAAGVVAIWHPLAGILIAPLGATFLGIGLALRRSARRAIADVVEYDRGFAATVGRRVVSAPWTDVASITSNEVFRSGKRGGVTYRAYEIVLRSGELLVLEPWTLGLQDAIGVFKGHTARVLGPALQAEYDAGATVAFGAVRASREAIELDGRRIPWSDVANASVTRGFLVVTPKDGSPIIEARVADIPNIEQLCSLIGIAPPLALTRYGRTSAG